MTEEHSHQDGIRKPKLKIEDNKLWELDENDDWVEAVSSFEPSDDPDIERLRSSPMSEVDRIASDEEHPLHDKAKKVISDAMNPMKEILLTALSPMYENISQQFGDIAFRGLSTNLWGDVLGAPFRRVSENLVGFKPYEEVIRNRAVTRDSAIAPADTDEAALDLDDVEEESSQDESSIVGSIDDDRSPVREKYTIHDAYLILQYMAAAQDEGNFERSQMRQENLEAAREASEWAEKANDWAEKSHSKANGAMWWAFGAVVVGLVSLAADLFGWGAA